MNRRTTKSAPLTYGEIARAIRGKIISGAWMPGQRLPTRRVWVSEFGTSPKTMQQALDRLISDGFVEARGSLGTFVSPRPPHLTDYAVIFPDSPESPTSWGGLWRSLSSSAKLFERPGDRRFPQFYGITGHTDSEDYQNLLRSLRSQRLAGLIFAASPFHLIGDPILEEPGIPRVAIMAPPPDLAIPGVSVDYPAFCDRALDYLADRGRKRIAALFYSGPTDVHIPEELFLTALQRRGFAHKPHWCQYVNVFHPTAVCRAVQMLLHTDQLERPDALVVTDDTMLDAVINGLFAAGVSVPRDVDVVAHANFPVAPTAIPIKRLGYDSRKLLQACVRVIDQQRRGEPVASVTELPPLFADEIEETVTA